MATIEECACKGIRQCPVCCLKNERSGLSGVSESFWGEKSFVVDHKTYVFCPVCELAHSYYSFHHNRRIGSTNLVEDICEAYSHEVCLCQGDNDVISGGSIIVPGVHIRVNFLDTVQESAVVNHIEQYPWKVSQSGRLKQDFGPKPNFKKKKLRLETFTGLPSFSEKLLVQMTSQMSKLSSFEAAEQCHLDYNSDRGSHIDPHFDDFWLWGERLVTVNLLSHSIITLSHPQTDLKVLVGQPRRSVVILSEDARNEWLHGIYANHIIGRRIAITYRELSNEMLHTEAGRKVLDIASHFTAQQPSS